MPTHVHVLVAQKTDWPLAAVVLSWKSFRAHAINTALGQSGSVWAREYFDRVMRDEGQVDDALTYIENNPVAAGLCNASEQWRWSSAFWRNEKDAGGTPALRDRP